LQGKIDLLQRGTIPRFLEWQCCRAWRPMNNPEQIRSGWDLRISAMRIIIGLLAATTTISPVALALAPISIFLCQGGPDRFEIEIDYQSNTVMFPKTRETVSAKISESFVEYTFTDNLLSVDNRIDRRTGDLYVLLGDKWQKSPLRCNQKQ
jgi:hypothetical protein